LVYFVPSCPVCCFRALPDDDRDAILEKAVPLMAQYGSSGVALSTRIITTAYMAHRKAESSAD
jgi:hypothetical protein